MIVLKCLSDSFGTFVADDIGEQAGMTYDSVNQQQKRQLIYNYH